MSCCNHTFQNCRPRSGDIVDEAAVLSSAENEECYGDSERREEIEEWRSIDPWSVVVCDRDLAWRDTSVYDCTCMKLVLSVRDITQGCPTIWYVAELWSWNWRIWLLRSWSWRLTINLWVFSYRVLSLLHTWYFHSTLVPFHNSHIDCSKRLGHKESSHHTAAQWQYSKPVTVRVQRPRLRDAFWKINLIGCICVVILCDEEKCSMCDARHDYVQRIARSLLEIEWMKDDRLKVLSGGLMRSKEKRNLAAVTWMHRYKNFTQRWKQNNPTPRGW